MILFSLGVVLMKTIIYRGASVLWITEMRLIAGTIGILFWILFRRDRVALLKPFLDFTTFKFAFPGTFLGNFLAMALWIEAFKLTNVTSAAILNQTSTISIVILASFLLKEPFTKRRIGATILAFAGSVLVMI
jgi:drug/metabolite transporter (DMT)-like permease